MEAPQPEDLMLTFVASIAKHGLMPLICGALLWFVYMLGTGIAADTRATREAMMMHADLSGQRAAAIQGTLLEQQRMQIILIDLLRQSCVNAAHTYPERQACFAAGAGR
jgi:hypothetical protein